MVFNADSYHNPKEIMECFTYQPSFRTDTTGSDRYRIQNGPNLAKTSYIFNENIKLVNKYM